MITCTNCNREFDSLLEFDRHANVGQPISTPEPRAEVVRLLNELAFVAVKLYEAWECDGGRWIDELPRVDGRKPDPFKMSLDEWYHEAYALAESYASIA